MAISPEHNGECSIDVEENLKEFELGASEVDSSVSIFGITPALLRLKHEAYVPQVISNGAYHDKSSQQYEETESYKLKLKCALEREVPGFNFSRLVGKMQSSDYRIRACYSKRISYSRDELSRILALDTSFIPLFLKSFCRSYKFSVDSQVDRILESIRNTPLWYAIEKDILMLENQVPMFVLIQAFLFITNSQSDTQMVNTSGREITQDDRRFQESNHLDVILQDACLHFNPFIREENYLPQPPDRNSTGHLLDYLYHYVTTASPQHQSNPLQQGCVIKLSKMVSTTTAGYIPSATELSEAGIKFAPYDSGDLRKICFKKTISTFFLPKININDFTEVVLRNLVAFELNLKEKQKPLTRYTFLMGRLIRTEGDVALLQRCGILNCQMDSDAEVARMWNCMCKSIGKNTFDPVEKAIDEAQKYYRSKWRVLLAEFWEKHSSKLWLVIPFLYAGMMLFLQAAQVFCLFHTCNK